MQVHITPEQEARLTAIASSERTDPQSLVERVLMRYLDSEERFLAAVDRGIAAAERSEFIEEDEMDRRIEQMFKR